MWFFKGNLPQEIEQWYHIPAVMGTIFTLIGIHFFDLITLIIIAAIVEFFFSILKYAFVSSYNFIYYTLGHSIVLWVWSIGTLIYFIIVGKWWLGAYALAYYIFLGSIIGLPGIIIVDGIAGKILGCHPKYYAVERLYGYDIREENPKENKVLKNDDIIYCPHCGSELPSEAKFCKNCGRKIE